MQLQPIPEAWVERLFERLAAILGAKLADVVAGADPAAVKREWAQSLAGFSDDEIRRGIAATRLRRFPPNLPEFLHLCRPALDAETAWLEAHDGMASHGRGEPFAWSHPAVYWAARQVQSELRNGSYTQHRKRWGMMMAQQWQAGAWCAPPNPEQASLPAPPEYFPGEHMTPADALRRMKQTRDEIAMRHQQVAE